MTTSIALAVRGDIAASLRANFVGTLLAAFLVFLVPWSAAGAIRGRMWFPWGMERTLTALLTVFIVLLLVRWAIEVGMRIG
jgi:hypothetical protein